MAIKRLEAGKHSCFGHITASAPLETGKASVVRDSLLVYVGTHESMDGPVTVTEEHIDRIVANHNARMAKYSKDGRVSLKACPPLQLDHSTSAAVTVGRVAGNLRKEEFLDEESGETRMGLFGPVLVLGAENVEKVMDGRWIHQSVGADLDEGKLNELSIVPFPAALSASFLSAKQARLAATQPPAEAEGAKKMTLMERVKKFFRLSKDEDFQDTEAKMKSHLTGIKGMSDDDAVKHMAEMDDDAMSALASEMDEHEKRMAAEAEEAAKLALNPPAGDGLDTQEINEPEHKPALSSEAPPESEEGDKEPKGEPAQAATLSAAPKGITMSAEEKDSFIKLAKGFQAASKSVQLAAKQARLTARLSGLRASAKITPAEIKKIDLVKLSAENEATIDAVFQSYESREPVILAGLFGSTKAQTVSELTSQIKLKKMEEDSRSNMPFLKAASKGKSKNRFSGEPAPMPGTKTEEDKPKEDLGAVEETEEPGSQDPTSTAQYDMAYDELCRLIDSGDVSAAKAGIKVLMEKFKGTSMGQEANPTPQPGDVSMSALAETVKSLHNQFEALVTLVGPKLGVESSEIERGV